MFSIKEILRATKGSLLQGKLSQKISGVFIDSRNVKRGHLYIAIKGDRFDGHDFVNDVIKKSVSAVIIAKHISFSKSHVAVIKVSDTKKALGDLARYHRDRFRIPIMAITGSAGKTTTKEMIADVLGQKYCVLKNIATQNNNIGVPLTLLKLHKRHQAVVIELGTNHFGEIKCLTNIANPTVAVFTNIGDSHLEFLKSRAGVFKEKSDLGKGLKKGGTIIYNADDVFLSKLRKFSKKYRLISCGVKNRSYFQGRNIWINDDLKLMFHVNQHIFMLNSPAEHNVYNALAALACGRLLNVPFDSIKKALKSFKFPKGRLLVRQFGSIKVIDDTYNANPLSMASAIKTLNFVNHRFQKVLVCGDMLELGKQSQRLHRFMGTLIAATNIQRVIAVGTFAKIIHEEIKKRNKQIASYYYNNAEAFCRDIHKHFHAHDIVLIKGSRGMKMERVMAALKKNFQS